MLRAMRPASAVTVLIGFVLLGSFITDYRMAVRLLLGLLIPLVGVVVIIGVLWIVEAAVDWNRLRNSEGLYDATGLSIIRAVRLEFRTDLLYSVATLGVVALLLIANERIGNQIKVLRMSFPGGTRVAPASNVRVVVTVKNLSDSTQPEFRRVFIITGPVEEVNYRIKRTASPRVVFANTASLAVRTDMDPGWSPALSIEAAGSVCSVESSESAHCRVSVVPLSATFLRIMQELTPVSGTSAALPVPVSGRFLKPTLAAVPTRDGWLLSLANNIRPDSTRPSNGDSTTHQRDSAASPVKHLKVSGGKTKLHIVLTPSDRKLTSFLREEEIRVENSPQLRYVGPPIKPEHAGWGRRQVGFVPLDADSISGIVSVALSDGTDLTGVLCKDDGCVESSVEVRALHRDSFLEAYHVKGADKATINQFREEETVTWAVTNPRRGVYFTYWTPPFRPYRWILDRFAYVGSLSELVHVLIGLGLGGVLITTLLSLVWRLLPDSGKRFLRRVPIIGGVVRKWERDEIVQDTD